MLAVACKTLCRSLHAVISNISFEFYDDVNRPTYELDRFFYRAMHFSAKHGFAIAVRLSVRTFVTLVICDHI